MSDDGGFWLLALGPAGAGALYWAPYRHYGNTDKSHAFEHETTLEAKPVTGSEHKVSQIEGTRKSRVHGDNAGAYRNRVKRVRSEGSGQGPPG